MHALDVRKNTTRQYISMIQDYKQKTFKIIMAMIKDLSNVKGSLFRSILIKSNLFLLIFPMSLSVPSH